MPRIVSIAFLVLMGLLLCAPTQARDQSRRLIKEAATAFARHEAETLRRTIIWTLGEPKGPARVTTFLTKTPAARTMVFEAQRAHIATASVVDLTNMEIAFTLFAKANVFDAASMGTLRDATAARVASGNLDGSLRWLLGPESARWPVLAQPEHQRVIVERTIAELQVGVERPVAGLMTYADAASAQEKGRILDLLPNLRLRADELPAVDAVYPGYSMAYRMTITARATLATTHADRIFELDLLARLRAGVRGVNWLDAPAAGALTVQVERVRHDERQTPEQTQTITYAQHQVNLMGAVLMMPRDASYLFDQVTSGASVDYGYVVTVSENGTKVHEEIVRGTATQNAVRCQNARIVNVFGGVQPASFVANPDMQQRCNGSQAVASLDQVRVQVLDRIRESVIKAAPIARVHALN